jgi:cation transport ATPase
MYQVKLMPYCPKCGNDVDETMTFCPRCGASLKMEAPVQASPAPQAPRRNEKAEKHEKREKQEKREPEGAEKHEKGEYGFIGWLIGGLILIFIGAMAFLNIHYHFVTSTVGWALFLLVIGVIIIIAAIYFATTARKHSPSPA